MKLIITMNLDSEAHDPTNETGLTSTAYEEITDLLMDYGTDIKTEVSA